MLVEKRDIVFNKVRSTYGSKLLMRNPFLDIRIFIAKMLSFYRLKVKQKPVTHKTESLVLTTRKAEGV